jgi:hypothetical protein
VKNEIRISSQIIPLSENIFSFISDRFSFHQLLNYYLDISGPANVSLSSFSICENAIRNFIWLIESDKILSIKALLDMSLTKRNINQLLFAKNVLKNIRLIENHSKLLFIFNNNFKIVIVGSANFSDNRKFESGIIFFNHPTFDKFIEQFDLLFSKSMPI